MQHLLCLLLYNSTKMEFTIINLRSLQSFAKPQLTYFFQNIILRQTDCQMSSILLCDFLQIKPFCLTLEPYG